MMKKGTKWVLGTAGTLIVVGLALRGVGFVMGGGRESRQYYEGRWEELQQDWKWDGIDISPDGVSLGGENGIRVDGSGVSVGGEHGIHIDHHGSEHGDRKQLVESGALTGITGIDVEVDCGDIYLQEGEECSVSLEWDLSNYTMSYQVEDGVLKVEDESWGAGGIPHDLSIACQVMLTVPAEMELKSLSLATNMGDISVEAAATVGEAELSTNLGDVDCRELRARELEAESDLGDVRLYLPGDKEEYTWKLETNMGELTEDGEKRSGGLGEVAYRSGTGPNSVEASSSLGNVEISFS